MIQLSSDGLDLSPEEYSQLLLKLSNNGIEADVYSRGGVVGNLEERMAALLGKEMCV